MSDSAESRLQLPWRGVAAALMVTTGLGAAGLAGFVAGVGAPAKAMGAFSLLSDPAHDTADEFAAAPRNVGVDAERVAALRSEYENRLAAMIAEQRRLKSDLERAEETLAALDDEADEDGGDSVGIEALAAAKRELLDLRLKLAEAESAKEGLARTLSTFAETMEQVIAERDRAAAKAESLEEGIASLSERQEETLRQIQDAARLSLDGMRKMFEQSGLDVDRILDQTREEYTGAGGPFEALAETVEANEDTGIRVAALMTDLEEVNLMRFAAKRLPFGVPVKGMRLTSRFGPRRDPLGRGHGLHKGVDWAGPKNTPIHATADGVVTFSGAQRGYGRIVVIRHAFGVETRYAHLNRSRVKVGERVERGDHIADMGNTGRSTGTHLHYEVRIDREAVDPAQFIEAARNVL